MALATADDVALDWRPLSPAGRARAEQLIAAAEAWIRQQRPDIADNDPIAKNVVIEVVRAAMSVPAEFTGHREYAEKMGPWSRSGTLITDAGALQFSRVHEQMLGISFEATPTGEFGDPTGYRYPPLGAVLP
ncbi:hypothetical protein [Nocardia brasiliensis]|uniref:hypothetical protein n=1 Tax=Nocardia brasiliensis TaxID=37326 RepID=UPI00366C186D